MQIIATGTALFFGLCAAIYLPAYVCTLYIKNISKVAVISGMITGFVSSTFWIFFIHEKEASSLQLCKALFGKPSLVKDTALSYLAMVDPIIISLPLSLIVTLVVGMIVKNKLSDEHIKKCFNGI